MFYEILRQSEIHARCCDGVSQYVLQLKSIGDN